jgi:hypothetical protein
LQPAPRPVFLWGGESPRKANPLLPGKLERVVFYEASASISVKKKNQGHSIDQATQHQGASGKHGQDLRISLWRGLIDMIKAKRLMAVSAALDLLAASEILSCFELQEKADLDPIRGPASRKTCCLRLLLCSRSALVSSFLLLLCLGLSLGLFLCLPPCSRTISFPCAVLVGANISDLNGAERRVEVGVVTFAIEHGHWANAVIAPAPVNPRPAGAASTPQPKQRPASAVLMKGGAGSSFTPVQKVQMCRCGSRQAADQISQLFFS